MSRMWDYWPIVFGPLQTCAAVGCMREVWLLKKDMEAYGSNALN